MKFTKEDIQQRVLQNGKPLDLDKFTWDLETRTFSTTEAGLVLDFKGIDNITFKTGSDRTFNTWDGCTFKAGSGCVVIRRDVFEVIKLEQGQKIRINGYSVVE